MAFISRKIQEKSSPFLKEKTSNNTLKTRVLFGPEIIRENKGKIIFSKNLFIWLIVSILVLFYLSLSVKNLFSPPEIIIYSPENNFITQEKTVVVKGKVEKGAVVTINNQIVSLNNNSFEEILPLVSGINLIKISARKKFGSEKTIFRQIIVEKSFPQEP